MEEIRLAHVAIRFVKYTDVYHGYAVFEFGRVSDIELEALEKAYARPLSPRNGDPTNGTLQKSEWYARLYTIRICLFVDEVHEGKDLIEKVHDNSDVTITYTDCNIRPTLRTIKHDRCASDKSWFGRFLVDWDQYVKEEEEKEEIKTNTPDGHYFMHVALNVTRSIGGHWYIVRIGRLDNGERTRLEQLSKNLNPLFIPPCGDPTEGKVIFSSERKGGFSEATVCVRSASGLEVGATYDRCHFRLETGGSRLELKDFNGTAGPTSLISCRNWFGTEKEEHEMNTVFEARGIVVCNRGSSFLQIGRLEGNERRRFHDFAGEYGSELNGQFSKLLTDASVWCEHDRVLKNVSFAEGIEFKPGEYIALGYIKIERTGNDFKVVTARRHTIDDGVRERWHLASAETPKDCRVTLDNVAVKIAKKIGLYYILEIGRLTADELARLEKVFQHVSDFNTYAHELDETKGAVLSREVRVTDCDGETWTYHVAKVCVYRPECDSTVGDVMDSATMTFESHHGNFRPTLEEIEKRDGIHNQYSGRWFERFPFEENPIKIRLNNVVAVKITREYDYSGVKATVEFSLALCCNYNQAVEDIGKARVIREGEPSRVSWNPHTKILKVNIQDDISKIEDIHSHALMLELQYNPDNGAWGINAMHKVVDYGAYGYFYPTRRSGKTAAMRAAMNAAYGLHSIPEGADFDGDVLAYCRADVITQESLWRAIKKSKEEEETMKFGVPKIKQLIFDDPTTVVIWEDGTKTIVHARDEKFDPEKGLAMAIARKALGNERDYYTYMQRQIKKGLRDSEGRKKKKPAPKKSTPEKPAAKKKTPAKKPVTAPKKKGGTKK